MGEALNPGPRRGARGSGRASGFTIRSQTVSSFEAHFDEFLEIVDQDDVWALQEVRLTRESQLSVGSRLLRKDVRPGWGPAQPAMEVAKPAKQGTAAYTTQTTKAAQHCGVATVPPGRPQDGAQAAREVAQIAGRRCQRDW